MIDLKELMGSQQYSSQSVRIQGNLMTLLERINSIRSAWAMPMTVTSGLRSQSEHRAIYNKRGIKDDSKIPWGSQHLLGSACDISDPSQELQKWLLANIPVLEKAQLWCEDFSATPNWVHFQTVPPKSGKRFFKP